MRQAEARLIQLAQRYSFNHISSVEHQQQDDTSSSSSSSSSSVIIEPIDTKIPKSKVLQNHVKSCQMFCNTTTTIGDDVEEEEESLTLHGVKVSSSAQHSKQKHPYPLLLLHGYANAAMYFYRNLHGLNTHYPTIYALDMLGWGLSSRPKFETPDKSVESAEHFFVESLEQWRQQNNLNKLTLAGHSMGGYLSVAYCEKYPQNVDRLILISPVGIPHRDPEMDKQRLNSAPIHIRMLFKTFRGLWSAGVTPGSFIRSLPESRSRKLVNGYVNGRLKYVDCEEEKAVVGEYLFTNSILPGSGEFALQRILHPGAYAIKPLLHRIPHLKIRNVSILYGDSDWMDPGGGVEVQKVCEERIANGQSNAPSVDLHIVKDAGHMLMLDNWEEFNAAMILSSGDVKAEDLHPSSKKPYSFYDYLSSFNFVENNIRMRFFTSRNNVEE